MAVQSGIRIALSIKVAIENIQKRAARFATGNYVFEHGSTAINMLKLGWSPLEERRAKIKLKLFYKAKMGLIQIPFDHLNNNMTKPRYATRQATNSYAIPTSNVDSHLYSFYPSTIRLWNSLPEEAKKLPNVDHFGNYLGNITFRSTYNSK